MGALGERFRQARLDRHVSLQDAQRETRIHRRFLEALENEDLAALPATVYARGFIRTYATYLELDPEPMVDLFHSMRGRDEPPPIVSATARISNPRPLSTRLIGIGTAAVFALLLIGYLWSQYNSFVESVRQADATPTPRSSVLPASSPPATFGSGGPLAGSPGPGGSPQPGPVATSPLLTAATPTRGLQVEVRANERTWLAVFVDGQQVIAEEVRPGFSNTYTAEQSVRVRVGNPAAIAVSVNGSTQGALGARGQPIEAIWTR